jgi:tetratricopeptide (TPR) repeat protein
VLSLSPLTDEDLEALVTQSLPEADAELIAIVLERAGGSPLYAEQLAAMLRERALPIAGGALDEAMIPSSVQALIAARIDALPPEPKRALMEASVVGKTFWSGALASLGEHEDLEATLGELVRREFCRPVHPSAMEGDEEFGFWHALVRDVAYAELTRAERATMHAATARWIAGRTAGAMGEDAEIIVHHLDAALELAPSAPEFDTASLTELLTDALIAAGQAAMRTEMPRAIPYLERALDALPADDQKRLGIMRLLASSHHAAGALTTAATLLDEALIQHQAHGNLEAATDVAIDLELLLWTMGKGRVGLTTVAGLKEELGSAPSPSLAKILAQEANWHAHGGDYEGAVSRAEEAIRMAETLGVDPPSRALAIRGLGRVALGDLGGEAEVRLAVAGYLHRGEADRASGSLYNLGVVMSGRGAATSLPYTEEAIELAERFGVDTDAWASRAGRLEGLADLGRFDEVVEGAGPILAWAAEHQDADTRFKALWSLAVVQIEWGEPAVDPQELADLSRRLGFEDALVLVAQLVFDEGDAALARSLLYEAIAHVEPTFAFTAARACVKAGLPELVETLLSRGVVRFRAEEAARLAAQAILAEAKGDQAAACRDYATAAEMFGALEMAPAQAHALQGLGRCLLVLGKSEEGESRLREARALWEDMKATRRIAEIDELMKALD